MSEKYDKLAVDVLQATQADAVMVVVIKGFRGTGYSICCVDPALSMEIVEKLREAANNIESTVLRES